jgi:hypothetical protein
MKKPRTPKPALPPPGLRPKLDKSQQLDLAVNHWTAVDAIAKGGANIDTLVQYIGGVTTWTFVASALRARNETPDTIARHAQMMEAFGTVTPLLDRYRRTGRVGFSGTEYQSAKAACETMDQLAAIVDKDVASAAADQSEDFVNKLLGVLNASV